MRVIVLCIVALCAAIATHGIEASHLRLSQENNSPSEVYKRFIRRLRGELGSETYQLYGIPVLKHSVSNYNRFYLMNATSNSDETITLAVDVEDLRAVAYSPLGSKESYFFLNAPQAAFHLVFSDTHQNILNFDNTFQSMENAASTTRQRTLLGEEPLDSAISNLFRHRREFLPVSFLVIIQMILEASKFRFIEQSMASSLRDGKTFTPDLAIVSLEDNWSELSLQIQASTSLQGLFGSAIELYNSSNEVIEVDSIHYPIVLANLALQRYHCKVVHNYIQMPSADVDVGSQEKSRCNVEARTTRISGREGFCVDVAGALTHDGSRLILYPCGQQVNQKWTFHSDRTIRSLGKCLSTPKSSRFGNSDLAVIYDCSRAAREDITWDVSISGSISNPSNDLVLTSKKATESTNLTMEVNTYSASQGWRVGNYVKPIISSIVGLKDMCLEATNGNTNIWLEECVKNKMEQSWALYSDGTIRVNNDHSLCVNSPSNDSSSKLITILSCNGSADQRWVFMADGTISTPKKEVMVMDVAQEAVSRKQIILHPRHGKANQQWVLFY